MVEIILCQLPFLILKSALICVRGSRNHNLKTINESPYLSPVLIVSLSATCLWNIEHSLPTLLYFWDVCYVSLLDKNFGKSTAYSCRTNILIWFRNFKKEQYTQLKTKQVKQINYNLWVFLNWETVLRESMQVYDDDDVNVTATDLRLTKTRPTSFNNKHNFF